jgi:hypothetical protein
LILTSVRLKLTCVVNEASMRTVVVVKMMFVVSDETMNVLNGLLSLRRHSGHQISMH